MKLFTVDFTPMYPVGGALIILAPTMEEAITIAGETIYHTKIFKVTEVDMTTPGVILYNSGDY